ncbi:unnamed protein product [Symbiodinium sp. CCMP2592]|nr:unnamed protein product [Symbiodinium sp. CCMP2592]
MDFEDSAGAQKGSSSFAQLLETWKERSRGSAPVFPPTAKASSAHHADHPASTPDSVGRELASIPAQDRGRQLSSFSRPNLEVQVCLAPLRRVPMLQDIRIHLNARQSLPSLEMLQGTAMPRAVADVAQELVLQPLMPCLQGRRYQVQIVTREVQQVLHLTYTRPTNEEDMDMPLHEGVMTGSGNVRCVAATTLSRFLRCLAGICC